MADERPQYQHGVGTIGGTQFHWGSGTPGKYWSVPYGDYPVTPDAPTGAWAHQVGAIPIANNVIPDQLLGRNRIGIMIHSGSASSLDQLYTQGCFKVAPSEWPAVRSEILKEASNGPLYLHVQPGGVAAFTNTKTFSQAGSQTPAANANAVANTTAASSSGTTVNAANAPIAGALAKQEAGPESAGQGAPTAASAGPQDLRQILYNKLTASGLQPHQALGALYSLGGESSTFNTGAYNPNDPGGSIGIGQWNGIRRTRLEDYAKAQGASVTDPNTQADFLIGSITDPKHPDYQPGVLDALKKAGTTADATSVWTTKFERPKVDNSAARFAAGPTRVGSLDQNNNFALGSGPSSNTTAAPGTAVAAAPEAAAADKPWWQKAFDAPTDAQGNPVAGGKSPFQQATTALQGGDKGSSIEQFRKAQEEEAPEGTVKNQAGQAPGARNVSPMGGALLPSVPQTYGQTINSLSTPLTWNSAPPRAPQMPPAGLQGMPGAQIPGTTLTSFQAPQEIGYGVDPRIGYGYA